MSLSYTQRLLWMFIFVHIGIGQPISWTINIISYCPGEPPACKGDVIIDVEAQQWTQNFATNFTFLAGLISKPPLDDHRSTKQGAA